MDAPARFRRHWLTGLAIGACQCIAPADVAAEEPTIAFSTRTYTYKRVGSLEIQLDVHRANDDVMRPAVVWIHGGALIMGSRRALLTAVTGPLLQAGYAVISIDYRLAPETKLPEIVKDVADAYQFVRTQGPSIFKVKPGNIAVLGRSAGGYLALMTGFCVEPRPAVLVSFYGYGDLRGKWYRAPSEFYRTKFARVTEDEARRVVGSRAIADATLGSPKRETFYTYVRQNGLWLEEVGGFNSQSREHEFGPFMPIEQVTTSYPPTLLIHGDRDTDVPYEQSVMMSEKLERHQVPHELITIANADHGLAGGDPQAVARAYADAVRFVIRHTSGDRGGVDHDVLR